MNGHIRTTLFRLCLALIVLLVSLTSASAQAPQEKPNPPQRESDALQLLNARIEKLESLIERQQRTLLEMQRRLDEANGAARIVPASSTLPESSDVASALHSTSVKTTQSPKASLATNQATQDKPQVVAGWGKDHPFLRSENGAFETQIGGYGQLDFRGYGSGDHPPNTFLVRRARISLEGKLERYFDFRIEGDFADTATALRDMYVNIHRIDEFQLRFGQFRVPISQEEMRSDNLQDFVERSLVNNLVPSRSPGVGASGSINKGVFEYQLGAWNGKGLLVANNNGTPETALRVRFNPWKHSESFLAKGFLFGGAVTQGRSAAGLSVRGLTESRSFTFFAPDTINGKYTRANAEMTWMLGPASIRAEYDQTNQHRDNLGIGGRNLPGVVAKGYMAQMTYLVTGEEKPEVGIVAPRNNLFSDGSGRQGLGAWELKFRYSNLQIADGTPKSNRAETFYFGTNWYLNRFVRYVLDLGIERFKDPARTPKLGENNLFVVLSRIQLAF
jgi:phosphate-selective porin OprO/OprP